MAAETILTYLKPNYPEYGTGAKGINIRLEYIGPTATILAAIPAEGATWGDYDGTVESTTYNTISGSNPAQSELSIAVSREFEAGDQPGTATESNYEIEWTRITKPMITHPDFRPLGGGQFELTTTDIVQIEAWRNGKVPTKKSAFEWPRYNSANRSEKPTWYGLSVNATKLANGVLMDIDTWEDYVPVARKTTGFVNGPPNTSTAGQKETPQGFVGLPQGYEWRKSADRGTRTGKQNKWDRTEEWEGALKVLYDNKKIYW